MKAFSPNVKVHVPQIDEVKAHVRSHQFVYGVVTGLLVSTLLTRRIKTNQRITVVIQK